MSLKRTTTIVIVGGAFAAWLAAAATSNQREIAAPITREPTAVEMRGTELAREVDRLHERLRPDTTPSGGRNLFRFAAARPAPAAPADERASFGQLPPPPSLPPAPPAVPQLQLSGVAENPGPDGPVRTAIISTAGQVYLVKEGENVTARYRVSRIASEVVELQDLQDGITLRLALK